MTQFVIVYDRHSGHSRIAEFSETEDALSARFAEEALAGENEEVAIISASSLADLARTHSRYFTGVRGAFGDLEAASA